MRDVAVTEGDKVEAQLRFGFSVNTYGVNDLVAVVDAVPDKDVAELAAEYTDSYDVVEALRPGGDQHDSLLYAARIEAGLRAFLTEGGFGGFTTTFEDLHGLKQLPGLACQRLMADGYGFGAEGDWKTAGLIRAMKVMSAGRPGGVSFMEDYTYHLVKGHERVLGAHMLEVCPSIAAGMPALETHPLGIGGKADPCRLVFDAAPGPAVNATLIDLGSRLRLIAAEVTAVPPERPMPKLPVARAMWIPEPDFKRGCEAWILAGGAHHVSFSRAVTVQHLQNFAEMIGIELVHIGAQTDITRFKNELRWNDVAFGSLR